LVTVALLLRTGLWEQTEVRVLFSEQLRLVVVVVERWIVLVFQVQVVAVVVEVRPAGAFLAEQERLDTQAAQAARTHIMVVVVVERLLLVLTQLRELVEVEYLLSLAVFHISLAVVVVVEPFLLILEVLL
jgi:hypothetical protein